MPATLSSKILTGILREQLGFKGIVVTDALDMGGIAHGFSVGDASVRALEAGADVLLMPTDPKAAIDAVVEAVNSGRISQQRIEESVSRLLTAKVRVGLAGSRLVDTGRLKALVNTPESNAAAQKIADKSVTLVRDEKKVVPLDGKASTIFYTLVESPGSSEGVAFETEVKKPMPSARFLRGSSAMSPADLEGLVQSADHYVVVVFASASPSRGSAALSGSLPGFVENLIATKKPVVFVAMGNPYLLRNFPDVAAYLTTYSTVAPSEVAAAKALFGEIAISGKVPVSIPGLAKVGDGIGVAQAKTPTLR